MSATSAAGFSDPLDLAQLRALLVALVRARTRSRTRFGRAQSSRGGIFQILFYGLMGFLVGLLATQGIDLFTFELILFGLTIFISGIGMMAESGDLLFGSTDYDVIGHRPVGARTLLVARTLAMLALTGGIGLAINLGPFLQGLGVPGARPWFPLAHLGALVLAEIFCCAAVVFAYGLFARVVGRQRFESLASWLQLLVTTTLLIGYRIVPNLIGRSHSFHIASDLKWLALFPPAWFAALVSLAAGSPSGAESARFVPMALIGVVMTGGLAALAVLRLAGDYVRGLSAFAEGSARLPAPASEDAAEPAAPRRTRAAAPDRALGESGVSRWLGPWMRDTIERASFQLVAIHLYRDRELRMRIFPSLASFAAFPILAFFDRRLATAMPMFTAVMASLLPATSLARLKTSTRHTASDIFRYAPLEGTAALFHGARKAVLLLMVVPVLIVDGFLLLIVVHDPRWLLPVIPVLVLFPTLSLISGAGSDFLMFSRAPLAGREGWIQNLTYLVAGVATLGLSIGGALAVGAGFFWQMVAAEVAVVAAIHAVLLRAIRRRALRPEP